MRTVHPDSVSHPKTPTTSSPATGKQVPQPSGETRRREHTVRDSSPLDKGYGWEQQQFDAGEPLPLTMSDTVDSETTNDDAITNTTLNTEPFVHVARFMYEPEAEWPKETYLKSTPKTWPTGKATTFGNSQSGDPQRVYPSVLLLRWLREKDNEGPAPWLREEQEREDDDIDLGALTYPGQHQEDEISTAFGTPEEQLAVLSNVGAWTKDLDSCHPA